MGDPFYDFKNRIQTLEGLFDDQDVSEWKVLSTTKFYTRYFDRAIVHFPRTPPSKYGRTTQVDGLKLDVVGLNVRKFGEWDNEIEIQRNELLGSYTFIFWSDRPEINLPDVIPFLQDHGYLFCLFHHTLMLGENGERIKAKNLKDDFLPLSLRDDTIHVLSTRRLNSYYGDEALFLYEIQKVEPKMTPEEFIKNCPAVI